MVPCSRSVPGRFYKGIRAPSSSPRHLTLLLEPLTLRDTALTTAICVFTRTQCVTCERGLAHFSESTSAILLRKLSYSLCRDPSHETTRGVKEPLRSSAAVSYLRCFSFAAFCEIVDQAREP
uniref:Uncharacterized protein n=1 Tax=Lygus hesperus TaxID=30085 RepID=A0A146LTP5_LYGHE